MTKTLDMICRYESGKLGHEETVWLFQELLDTGLWRQLQGHYGQTPMAMLQAGLLCQPPNGRERAPQ